MALWYAAEYHECLKSLESVGPCADRFLLASRAAYRLRDYRRSLEQLRLGDHGFSDAQKIFADSFSAVLNQLLGRTREAKAFVDRVFLASEEYLALPEVAVNVALWAWLCDDLIWTERALRRADFSSDATSHAQALSLRSWIRSSRGCFVEQIAMLREALAFALAATPCDVGLVANILQALSARCRDVHAPDAFEEVCTAAEPMRWTKELAVSAFATLRHIGWTKAVYGDHITGRRYLNRSAALAPSPAHQVLSLLDHAWVAAVSNEPVTAKADLYDAHDAMRRINWKAVTGEELVVFPLAAELFADVAPKQGDALLKRADAAFRRMSSAMALRHDHVWDGLMDYARATVLSKSGSFASSRKYAKRAFEHFSDIRFDWRAARCALLLYHSGAGDAWLKSAQKRALHYPRSFIGADLQRIALDSESKTLGKLTPRQRDVAKLLATGASPQSIASDLNLSINTIRVHTGHIYQTLGVHSRAELMRQTADIA